MRRLSLKFKYEPVKKERKMKFLNGYKTYIVVVIGVIFNGLVVAGYIDEGLRPTVNSVLTFLGLGTMRDAINKVK